MPTNNTGKTPINTRKPVQKTQAAGQSQPQKNTGNQNNSRPSTPKQPEQQPSNTVHMRMELARDEIMLDDTALVTDILVTQKTLVKRYGNALCEGSCQKFRSILNNHLGEIASDQFDSFLYMQQNQMYPTEPAQSQKLCEAKDKFKQTEQKMKR